MSCFSIINASKLSEAHIALLCDDLRLLRQEMSDDGKEDGALPPTRADAERELLRRIGGQRNIVAYVQCLRPLPFNVTSA